MRQAQRAAAMEAQRLMQAQRGQQAQALRSGAQQQQGNQIKRKKRSVLDYFRQDQVKEDLLLTRKCVC